MILKKKILKILKNFKKIKNKKIKIEKKKNNDTKQSNQ